MAEGSRAVLRDFLVERYSHLKYLLSRRLGNPDLAGDALQAAPGRQRQHRRHRTGAEPRCVSLSHGLQRGD